MYKRIYYKEKTNEMFSGFGGRINARDYIKVKNKNRKRPFKTCWRR